MARIPTYQEQTVNTSQTVKLQGKDYVAGALQQLGGALGDVANVVGKYQQKKETLAANAAIASNTANYNQYVAQTNAELTQQVQQGKITFDDAKGLFEQKVDEYKSAYIDSSNYSDDIKARLTNDFTVASANSKIQSNAYWDKQITDKHIFEIKNAGDELMRQAYAQQFSGNMDGAESYKVLAKQQYESLAGYIGDDKVQDLIQAGRYSSYSHGISVSLTEQDVDSIVETIKQDKDVSPEQTSKLMYDANSRKRGLNAEIAANEKKQKTAWHESYNQYQTQAKAIGMPMNPSELKAGMEAGLWSQNEVNLGQIEFDKAVKVETTKAQEQNFKDLDYQIKVGTVASYKDIWEKYLSGDITLEQARMAETSISGRIVAARTEDQKAEAEARLGIIQTGKRDKLFQLGKTITTIDEYNEVMQSINDDPSLSIDDRIAQYQAATALYATRKDPAMSESYHNAYIRLMDIENKIRKYNPDFDAGSFTNKIFTAKNKTNPEEITNYANSLIQQYQGQIDAAIQGELRSRDIGKTGAVKTEANVVDWNTL